MPYTSHGRSQHLMRQHCLKDSYRDRVKAVEGEVKCQVSQSNRDKAVDPWVEAPYSDECVMGEVPVEVHTLRDLMGDLVEEHILGRHVGRLSGSQAGAREVVDRFPCSRPTQSMCQKSVRLL